MFGPRYFGRNYYARHFFGAGGATGSVKPVASGRATIKVTRGVAVIEATGSAAIISSMLASMRITPR